MNCGPVTAFFIRQAMREKIFRRIIISEHAITGALSVFLLSALLFSVPVSECMATDESGTITRFFRMGDGRLHVRSNKNGLETKVRLLKQNGAFDDDALAALDEVFGFPPEKRDHVSLRLLFLLDYFTDMAAKDALIELESGFRSVEHNRRLRESGGTVAPTSTHIDAMAIDFSIPGVAGKQLWELIRKEDCCGVGHYGGKTIHLDSGRPRFWETATAGVDSGKSDFNRRLYLSTEYDRYMAGEGVRLILSSVSNYGFGVDRSIAILKEGSTGESDPVDGWIQSDSECIPINGRSDGRALLVRLPATLAPGRYRVRLDFCDVPFPQMPANVLSNVIEVVER